MVYLCLSVYFFFFFVFFVGFFWLYQGRTMFDDFPQLINVRKPIVCF